jgi:hypothetical protein
MYNTPALPLRSQAVIGFGIALLATLGLTSAQWQKIATKHAPPGTAPSGQMCDTAVGVLLYTGSATWLFFDGDWHLQTQGIQPPGRGASALTRYGDGALMFGGQGSTGMLGDTWVWTAARGWAPLAPSSSRAPDRGNPVNRSMHSLATVNLGGADGDVVILFGGVTTGEPRMTALGDTWLLAASHGSRWYRHTFNVTRVPGTTIEHAAAPPKRWGHSMACHGAPAGPLGSGFCMMFGGGVTQDDHFSDTWRFDFGEMKAHHGWSLVVPVQTPTTTPPLTVPPGRWSYQLAACGTGALMASGSTGYRVCTDDTCAHSAHLPTCLSVGQQLPPALARVHTPCAWGCGWRWWCLSEMTEYR